MGLSWVVIALVVLVVLVVFAGIKTIPQGLQLHHRNASAASRGPCSRAST